MTANRLLFVAVLAVLVLLVVRMLILSTGTPDGPESLAAPVRGLIGVGLIVLLARAINRISGRQRGLVIRS